MALSRAGPQVMGQLPEPSFDNIGPSLVISLEREPARFEYVQSIFSRHKLSLERVDAVDARRLSDLRGPEIVPARRSSRFSHIIQKDYALTMSHRKAALRLLASGAPMGLIMEDDIDFTASFPRLLSLVASAPPADIVKFEGIGAARIVLPVGEVEDRILAATVKPISGAACYLATRRGAQCLVSLTETAWGPFDHVLAAAIRYVSILHVLPYPVYQRPEAFVDRSEPSDVVPSSLCLSDRLVREYHRNVLLLRGAGRIARQFPARPWRWKRVNLQEQASAMCQPVG